MYPRCLQQLRLSWLQTQIVTAPPTLPDNNNPSSEGQLFLSEHKRAPRSLEWCFGIKRQLFLPVLLLPTPPIVATTLEDLTYTRPPRLPTTDWLPSKAVPPAPIVLLHSSARGTSFHPVVLTCLLALKVVSSYSGLEILTPSKMMIRMVMIRMMMTFITIIWSSNHQEHWLFRWSVFNCSPSKRSRRQPRVRKCPLINSKHRKHTLGVPTFKILLNWILLLLFYLIISPALMVWSWPEAYSEASIICYNFYLASSKSHRQKNN